MKRFVNYLIPFFAMAIVCAMSYSCSKTELTDNEIVGTWRETEVSYKVYIDGQLEEQGTDTLTDSYMEFILQSGGTGIYLAYDEGEPDSDRTPMTWQITDGKFQVAIDGMPLEIISITPDEMYVYFVYEFYDDYYEANIKAVYLYKFVKYSLQQG